MPEQAHRKRGRQAFVPTDKQRQTVQVHRANGDGLATIAGRVGITEKTLRKHFSAELADGHAQVCAAMGAAVVRAGLAGNMYAAKYWLSTHGGPEWRENKRVQIGAFEGAPPVAAGGEARVVVYLPDNGRGDRGNDPDD